MGPEAVSSRTLGLAPAERKAGTQVIGSTTLGADVADERDDDAAWR